MREMERVGPAVVLTPRGNEAPKMTLARRIPGRRVGGAVRGIVRARIVGCEDIAPEREGVVGLRPADT